VILPDNGKDLLRTELALAFEELGFSVLRARPEALHDQHGAGYLPRLLDEGPALLFSVNMQGVLPGGAGSKMLAKAVARHDLEVVLWFVDNPWHVLSGMRDPDWKIFTLAVTDRSFVEPLRRAGARRVEHLPLAVDPRLARQSGVEPPSAGARSAGLPGGALREVVFAGRTAFPGKETFFAGLELPPALLEEAGLMGLQGRRADFDWWLKRLHLEQTALWPGKKSRLPGFGAAHSNKIWREQRLLAVLEQTACGLTLFGDSAWRADLRKAGSRLDLRPPFDYYAYAHRLYRQAAFSLNLNSLLLGAGLTQRIFDIWSVQGFCLTDDSPGLEIFPAELTRPVTFSTPEELAERIAYFQARPGQKQELSLAWRGHILREHTYTNRLASLLF
jgi:hypothetical protein